MGYKAIKVSEQNYRWLVRESAAMAYESGEKKTFNDVVDKMKKQSVKSSSQYDDIMKSAGIWSDISEKEAEKLRSGLESLRRPWRKEIDLS